MKLKVKNNVGQIQEVDFDPSSSVQSVKQYLSTQTQIPVHDVKLVFSDQLLANDKSLQHYLLPEGATVVMLHARMPSLIAEDPTPTPTKATILQATGGTLPSAKPRRLVPAQNVTQLRDQLTDLMSSFIGIPPRAATTPATPQTTTAPQPAQPLPMDQTSLQMLVDMGFPENRAKKALTLARMNTQIAMEWLIEHGDDADIDEPIPEEDLEEITKEDADFVPNPEAVEKLKDMGFAEDQITTALRVTNNNSEAAAAWLLGDRDVAEMSMPAFEDSNLIRAVLSNPTIQAGLNNPRVLHALKQLMENPASAAQYANDPEVGPILHLVHNIVSNN